MTGQKPSIGPLTAILIAGLFIVLSASSVMGGDDTMDTAVEGNKPEIRDSPRLEMGWSDRGVDPASSGNYTTTYTYRVLYIHPYNRAPTSQQTNLYIDGSLNPFLMTRESTGTPDYSTGEWYTYALQFDEFSPLDHTYRFEFNTSDYPSQNLKNPVTGVHSGPDVPNDQYPKLDHPSRSAMLVPNTEPYFDTDYLGQPINYQFGCRYSEADNFAPAGGYPRLVVRDTQSSVEVVNETMERDDGSGNVFHTGYDYYYFKSLTPGDYDYFFVALRNQPTDGGTLTPPHLDENTITYLPASYDALGNRIKPPVGSGYPLKVEQFPNPPPDPRLTNGTVDPQTGYKEDVFEFMVTYTGYVPVSSATMYYQKEGGTWKTANMTAPLSYPGNDGLMMNGETYTVFMDGIDLGIGQFNCYFNFTDAVGRPVQYPTGDPLPYPKVWGSFQESVEFSLTGGTMEVVGKPGLTKGHIWDQFRFRVNYTGSSSPKHPGTDIPSSPKLVIDGYRSWEMLPDPNTANFDYADGEMYQITLPGHVIDETGVVGHTYFFQASDGISPLKSTEPETGPHFYPVISAEVSPGEGGRYDGFEYKVTYRDPDNDPARNLSLYMVVDGDTSNPVFVVDFIDVLLRADAADIHSDFAYRRDENIPDYTKYASGVTFTITSIDMDPAHSYGFFVKATDMTGADPDDRDQWSYYPNNAPVDYVTGPVVLSTGQTSGMEVVDLQAVRESELTGPPGNEVVEYKTYMDFTLSNTGGTDLGSISLEMVWHEKSYTYPAPSIPGGLRRGEDIKQRVQVPSSWEQVMVPGTHTFTIKATANTVKGSALIIASRDLSFTTGPVIQLDTTMTGPTSLIEGRDFENLTISLRNIGELPDKNNPQVTVQFKIKVNDLATYTSGWESMDASEPVKTFHITGFDSPSSETIKTPHSVRVVVTYDLNGASSVSHQQYQVAERGQVVLTLDVAREVEGSPSFAPGYTMALLVLTAVALMSYQQGRRGPTRGPGSHRFSRRLREEKEAVSPVIATILLVSITVVIVGMLYYWVSSFVTTTKIASPKAQAITQFDKENGWFQVEIINVKESSSPGLAGISYEIRDSDGAIKKRSLTGELDDKDVYGLIPGEDNPIAYFDAHPADGLLSQDDVILIREDPNNGAQRGEYIRLVYIDTGEEILNQILL